MPGPVLPGRYSVTIKKLHGDAPVRTVPFSQRPEAESWFRAELLLGSREGVQVKLLDGETELANGTLFLGSLAISL